MKKTFLVFLLFSAMLACGQSNDKIAAAVERLNTALVAADSITLDQLTVPDLSYGHSSGAVEDKPTFIRTVLSGPIRFQSIQTTSQTITRDKRTAVVRHRLEAKATNNGTPTDINLSVLQVWQKKGGAWKLLARQAVRL